MLTLADREDYEKKISRIKQSIRNAEYCIDVIECPIQIKKFENFIAKKQNELWEVLTEYRENKKID